MGKKHWIFVAAFLLAQAAAYYLILTAGGDVLRYSEFGAIVLCALFAAAHFAKGNRWIIAGLLCTVGADLCLVLLQPMQQLWGMVFFVGTQSCYAIHLWLRQKNKILLWVRLGLIVVAEAVTVIVLRDKTDPLAVISLAYYAMLIMNIVVAFSQWKKDKLLPVALVLYIPELGFMLAIVFLAIYYALMGFASILLLKTPLEQRLGEYRDNHPQEEEKE
jgi:uncharacterized membrane protein YhhN